MWDCRIPLPAALQILITFTLFFLISTKTKNKSNHNYGSLSLLSNDDGDGNEKGKKSNRFRLAKQQLCTLLHDYNVKVSNFTFCRGRGHKTTTFFFSFPEL